MTPLTSVSKHPLYVTWHGMRQRCLNQKNSNYRRYGGRGITICERWLADFWAFVADMGERPEGTTIDRHPNKDGNYEPGNCRWATADEQCANKNGPCLRMLTFNGLTKPMYQWEQERGLGHNVLFMRLKHGWTIEQAISTPPRGITHTNVRAYRSAERLRAVR